MLNLCKTFIYISVISRKILIGIYKLIFAQYDHQESVHPLDDKSHICVKNLVTHIARHSLGITCFRALCDCTNVLQEANLLKQKKISHRAIIYYDGLSSSLAECSLFIH